MIGLTGFRCTIKGTTMLDSCIYDISLSNGLAGRLEHDFFLLCRMSKIRVSFSNSETDFVAVFCVFFSRGQGLLFFLSLDHKVSSFLNELMWPHTQFSDIKKVSHSVGITLYHLIKTLDTKAAVNGCIQANCRVWTAYHIHARYFVLAQKCSGLFCSLLAYPLEILFLEI